MERYCLGGAWGLNWRDISSAVDEFTKTIVMHTREVGKLERGCGRSGAEDPAPEPMYMRKISPIDSHALSIAMFPMSAGKMWQIGGSANDAADSLGSILVAH